MYQPTHFYEDRLEVQHALMRAHPLGLLVSAGAGGLSANPIPFVLDTATGDKGTLRCHLARANLQWKDLSSVGECLVVFQGSDAYVTPSWYKTKKETGKVVPTWNYVTVHAWGRPRVIDDATWLRANVEALTRIHEAGRPVPWEVSDAPADFIDVMLRGIIGIEIEIARIEGKWKVSQNRPEADRVGVERGLKVDGKGDVAAIVAERSGIAKAEVKP
jgi:transcriptional regulator